MATTLPREIIKWMQGLDLSYSVKDIKKDLSNGFLIAEILLRYFPGQIQMHSFDNSQKKERKQNNWQLLDKVFQKQEMPFSKQDYNNIVENNDAEQLINFMVRLYAELTGKKVNRNALVTIQNFNKTLGAAGKQDEFHQSFLLKDRGLEKLNQEKEAKEEKAEEKKPKDKEKEDEEAKAKDDKEQQAKSMAKFDLTKSSSNITSNKLKTFLKYESKPISPRPELSNLKFEVKSTNIRPLNINVSKLRATKDQNVTGTLNYTHLSVEKPNEDNIRDNRENRTGLSAQGMYHQAHSATESSKGQHTTKKEKLMEQTLYDILGEMLEKKLASGSFAAEYMNFNLKSYPESITGFSDYFNAAIFKEIYDRVDFILAFIIKDLNEAWKLLNFMLNCLKNVLIDKEYFKMMIDILKYVGEKSVSKDPVKAIKLIKENFLETIYNQIVLAPIFEKKEHLAMLLYYFIPNTADAKRQIILAYKDVAKDQKILMETLVILIASERNRSSPTNSIEDVHFYFEIGMKYVKIGIQSSNPVTRTMTLAILANLARLNYELVYDFVKNRLEELSLEEWWEDKCQVIMTCSRIIFGLISTDNYQNLVKKSTQNYTKNYSWQNEQLANKLKEDIKLFGDAIIRVLQSKPNNYVVRVFIVYCVDICHEVKGIMDQIVAILVQSNTQFREWFFHNREAIREEFFVYNDKSLRYKTGFDSDELRKSSKEFLTSLTDNVRENTPETLEASHFEILEFGLLHTDFKVLNIELLLGITNLFVPYIFSALCDENLIEIATRVLKIFLMFKIEQDLRIKDLESHFAAAFIHMYESGQETCINNMKEIIQWHRQEAEIRRLYRERDLFKDILNNVVNQGAEKQFLDEIQGFMENIVASFGTETEPDH